MCRIIADHDCRTRKKLFYSHSPFVSERRVDLGSWNYVFSQTDNRTFLRRDDIVIRKGSLNSTSGRDTRHAATSLLPVVTTVTWCTLILTIRFTRRTWVLASAVAELLCGGISTVTIASCTARLLVCQLLLKSYYELTQWNQ